MLEQVMQILLGLGGAAYLLAYLMCGWWIIRCLLPRHSPLTRLWLGMSLGLLMMMWLPALLAFGVDFTMTAHLLALIPLAGLTAGAWFLRDRRPVQGWTREESTLLGQMLLVVLPLTLLSGYLQYTHYVRIGSDGGWWGGQSTYGDLAMHMSFVTSLKNAAFPPEYALFPGQQLSYPFLMDSLSTSLYLFGWPLQLTMTVPGTLMMALCYMGVMCLAREMTAGKKTVVLAALLFFLNGGLGFIYDFDLAGGVEADGTLTIWRRIEAILEGYYKTPTNQPTPNNLRWSNVIADLMLPQRTLLGGWCMVIPCFYLLFTTFRTPSASLADDSSHGEGASRASAWRPVVLLGVWGGALPLIHTHSFTALALCSLGLVTYDVLHLPGRNEPKARWEQLVVWGSAAVYALLTAVLLAAHIRWPEKVRLWMLAAPGAAALVSAFVAIRMGNPPAETQLKGRWRLLGWYVLYGGIACVLSVPQLFGFTFNQVFQEGMQGAGNSFIEVWFNWVNSGDGTVQGMIDGYGWFYLKNIGLPFLILIFALFERNPRWRRIFAGALPIILAGEMIRFQPNIYDNNKLLYLAWLLCAMIVADWCRKLWHKLKGLRARPVIAALAVATFFLSAGLTLWREALSNYQLFSPQAVAVGEYVRDNTEEDATFLTGVHHLNPVASIAGRKIVCGPDLWLYYHGLDTDDRKFDIRCFYADPAGQKEVLEKYGVDYIMVSSYERSDYAIDREALDAQYTRVFENREATIWRVAPQEEN